MEAALAAVPMTSDGVKEEVFGGQILLRLTNFAMPRQVVDQ